MLKPSVCIDAVLEGMPLAEALRLVADCGYSAFEFWAWWEKDLAEINRVRAELNLSVSACCTKFISLTDPNFRDDYVSGVRDSIEAAKELACPTLISQVGDLLPNLSRSEQHDSIVSGLLSSAPLLEASGITLVIEPLNEVVDHPGYYLVGSNEAFDIVEEVGSPNVKVVFDIYHQQISEGNLLTRITSHVDEIGHFHAAGNPGRHELTLGEINYPQIFAAIRETNYDGYVGLEYWPKAAAEIGLREVRTWF
jgi:hydroxypyruvate isomerase